jgi:hypothetical protein
MHTITYYLNLIHQEALQFEYLLKDQCKLFKIKKFLNWSQIK